MSDDLKVSMRVVWLDGHPTEWFRVKRPNGFGGKWCRTPYLALASFRRRCRAERSR